VLKEREDAEVEKHTTERYRVSIEVGVYKGFEGGETQVVVMGTVVFLDLGSGVS
jgi:hypothetical protein